MSRPLEPSPELEPPRMEYGAYSMVGRSLDELVAMPVSPSARSSTEAIQKYFCRILRTSIQMNRTSA